MPKKWQFISGIVATLKRNGGSFAPDYACDLFAMFVVRIMNLILKSGSMGIMTSHSAPFLA